MELQTAETVGSDHFFHSGKALQLFRICQEVIHNACRHAQATVLSLNAETSNGHFRLTISDNGRGFDSDGSEKAGHYGLQNMQERAKESAIELRIESAPGKGTSVHIDFTLS
ncbi:MAG TPA: ATP-binding protein [Ferruginibacter sp.]|nr:ATP-binding protein [Ferruginibacter sp.]